MGIFAPRERREYEVWPPVDVQDGRIAANASRSRPSRENETHDSEGWRTAEEAAAQFMRKSLGFSDATLTQDGADGGVDIISSRAVAQVKYRAQPTSRPEVQQLNGVARSAEHDGKKALFFSKNGFTAGAEKFARDNLIALFELSLESGVRPIGREAGRLTENPSRIRQVLGTSLEPSNSQLRILRDP